MYYSHKPVKIVSMCVHGKDNDFQSASLCCLSLEYHDSADK